MFGPTGVGKTELIRSIFSEGFEVVSVDSMQVYRGLDIGTAKPAPEMLEKIPHHLIDIIDPDRLFGAGDFVEEADRAVALIHSRGRHVLLSGGTAFYFRNFMYGLPEAPKADPVIRKKLLKEHEEKGLPALFAELERIDPRRAARLHPNDTSRIIRSLEVCRSTGRPHTDFEVSQSPRNIYRFLPIGLRRDREELYRRTDRRVDEMFDAGLENEVRRLIGGGLREHDPAMKGIGYREFFTHPGAERETIKRNSRRYAKRQMTFFSSLPRVRWVHPDEIEAVEKLVKDFLAG